MWYMIYGVDNAASSEKRSQARPAHLARLQTLRDAGRLLLAGPLPQVMEQEAMEPGSTHMVGSLILADFASLDEARAWAEDDPYAHAGVYRETHIHPWKGVFMPSPDGNPTQVTL
ncbi:MAG: YciI family protein [Halothiobacillaceae bacterium]|nr:YciI family protein [Halothiobacillaceae bacterium]